VSGEPEWTYKEVPLPDWMDEPGAAPSSWDEGELRQKLADLKRVDDPKRVEESLKRDKLFLERKEQNKELLADPVRVGTDLAVAGITHDQFEDMKDGDPAHDGDRLPLGFESYEQLQEFRQDLDNAISSITVNGQPATASVQVMGSSTTFYSGNPDKDLGHHFDKKGPGASDYDIDIVSPELVKQLLQHPSPAANDVVLRGGERVIFKSGGEGGFYQTFPQFEALSRK